MSIIKELKDPKLAQPFGVYEKYFPEKAEALKKAGKENCLVLCRSGGWVDSNFGFHDTSTYILKPDYQPEPQPEYVDLEIVRGADWYGAESRPDFILPVQFVPLHCLVSLPGFAGFWSDENHQCEDDIAFQYISREIDKGHIVYARFRKE